ncbi:MAG: DUF805 domain-containing protein [Bacteroidaceae bacterium]|nr:DUF805 domain-containing protein [Bacteroidaceae bacterium]
MEWFLKCWRQYADFSGRARRKEYWMFYLFNSLIGFVTGFIDGILFGGELMIISWIYILVAFLPGLAVSVRRLHDVGKSGLMMFVCLIPFVGAIWLFVLSCMDSEPESNKWGDNPKIQKVY